MKKLRGKNWSRFQGLKPAFTDRALEITAPNGTQIIFDQGYIYFFDRSGWWQTHPDFATS
jgi:hypothetical protein